MPSQMCDFLSSQHTNKRHHESFYMAPESTYNPNHISADKCLTINIWTYLAIMQTKQADPCATHRAKLQ